MSDELKKPFIGTKQPRTRITKPDESPVEKVVADTAPVEEAREDNGESTPNFPFQKPFNAAGTVVQDSTGRTVTQVGLPHAPQKTREALAEMVAAAMNSFVED